MMRWFFSFDNEAWKTISRYFILSSYIYGLSDSHTHQSILTHFTIRYFFSIHQPKLMNSHYTSNSGCPCHDLQKKISEICPVQFRTCGSIILSDFGDRIQNTACTRDRYQTKTVCSTCRYNTTHRKSVCGFIISFKPYGTHGGYDYSTYYAFSCSTTVRDFVRIAHGMEQDIQWNALSKRCTRRIDSMNHMRMDRSSPQ